VPGTSIGDGQTIGVRGACGANRWLTVEVPLKLIPKQVDLLCISGSVTTRRADGPKLRIREYDRDAHASRQSQR